MIDAKRDQGSPALAARRVFRCGPAGDQVTVTVSCPVVEANVDPETWIAEIRVERTGQQPSLEQSAGRGVDALQALVVALQKLRTLLAPAKYGLRWQGEAGDLGLPLVVTGNSAAEDELYAAVVLAEKQRQIVWREDVMWRLRRDHRDDSED